MLGDAAATALLVAGPDSWPAVARALGLDQVAIVDESGTVYMTAKMEQRLQFTGDVNWMVIDNLDTP